MFARVNCIAIISFYCLFSLPYHSLFSASAYNKINEEAVGEPLSHDAEQVIEAYWAWGLSKWATITPDVQFYINPALNQKSDYGTAVSLRLTLFL